MCGLRFRKRQIEGPCEDHVWAIKGHILAISRKGELWDTPRIVKFGMKHPWAHQFWFRKNQFEGLCEDHVLARDYQKDATIPDSSRIPNSSKGKRWGTTTSTSFANQKGERSTDWSEHKTLSLKDPHRTDSEEQQKPRPSWRWMKIVDMFWQICNDLDNPTGEQNWHYDQMKLILVLIIWYFYVLTLILIFPNL